jgi:hypothetical protein
MEGRWHRSIDSIIRFVGNAEPGIRRQQRNVESVRVRTYDGRKERSVSRNRSVEADIIPHLFGDTPLPRKLLESCSGILRI